MRTLEIQETFAVSGGVIPAVAVAVKVAVKVVIPWVASITASCALNTK